MPLASGNKMYQVHIELVNGSLLINHCLKVTFTFNNVRYLRYLLLSLFSGAFNSTRESQHRSQLAQHKVDRTADTIDQSMQIRDQVERLIDNYEDSFHEKISENQQDLDEIDGQIGGLEDKIAQLNKIVCSAHT